MAAENPTSQYGNETIMEGLRKFVHLSTKFVLVLFLLIFGVVMIFGDWYFGSLGIAEKFVHTTQVDLFLTKISLMSYAWGNCLSLTYALVTSVAIETYRHERHDKKNAWAAIALVACLAMIGCDLVNDEGGYLKYLLIHQGSLFQFQGNAGHIIPSNPNLLWILGAIVVAVTSLGGDFVKLAVTAGVKVVAKKHGEKVELIINIVDTVFKIFTLIAGVAVILLLNFILVSATLNTFMPGEIAHMIAIAASIGYILTWLLWDNEYFVVLLKKERVPPIFAAFLGACLSIGNIGACWVGLLYIITGDKDVFHKLLPPSSTWDPLMVSNLVGTMGIIMFAAPVLRYIANMLGDEEQDEEPEADSEKPSKQAEAEGADDSSKNIPKPDFIPLEGIRVYYKSDAITVDKGRQRVKGEQLAVGHVIRLKVGENSISGLVCEITYNQVRFLELREEQVVLSPYYTTNYGSELLFTRVVKVEE